MSNIEKSQTNQNGSPVTSMGVFIENIFVIVGALSVDTPSDT
jgi:hypothetical protein